MHSSKILKRSFLAAVLALLAALIAAGTATFAWYLYNSKARTTNVRMAAGTATSLEIAGDYGGPYSSSTPLSTYEAWLNPVSTNDIQAGFRKVLGFTNGTENHLVARWFQNAAWEDYFSAKLYLRAKGNPLDLYLSNISYFDNDPGNPISTAIRVGLLVHTPGQGQSVAAQYIFEINDGHIERPDYNTYTGGEGHVLDVHSADMEAVVPFTPYTAANYCLYDAATGAVTLQPDSIKLCTLPCEPGDTGVPVEVEVFIWLEGCDEDCTLDIVRSNLENLALNFAGKAV